MRTQRITVTLAWLSFMPCFVFAQSIGADPATLLRAESLSRERQERLDANLPRVTLGSSPRLNSSPVDVAEHGSVIKSPEIRIEVPETLKSIDWSPVLERYRNLPIGQQRLQLLLRQLNARLVEHGLVTARATLKEASISKQLIRIAVIPGYVEALKNDGAALPEELRYAMPFKEGDLLRLPDIEQGIHQINRLRLYRAEARIAPGQTPGGSIIDLTLHTGPWWNASMGADNLGNTATGIARLRGTLNMDNRLGLLDSFGLMTVITERSQTLLGSLAIPQGYNTWSITAYGSRYRQTINGNLQQDGTSRGITLAWNRVLYLSAEGRDALDLGLTRTAGRRQLENIDLAPEDLTVMRVSLNRVRRGQNLQWQAEGALGFGLHAFGARKDAPNLQRTDIHNQFTKAEVHASLAWQPRGEKWFYTLQSDAQYTHVSLYGGEQLRMSGMTALRGFSESLLFVDRGILLRHELHFPVLGQEKSGAGRLAPYLLFDQGQGALVGKHPLYLSSAGFGLRWISPKGNADLVLAAPINCPANLTKRETRLNLMVNFPL